MPQSILVVRLSALGDIVHALPVLAALRRARPAAAVDWLVEEAYADVLTLATGLRRCIVVRARTSSESARYVAFGGTTGVVRAVAYLRRQHYDMALDLQGLIKSALWARLSGAREVIGFDAAHLRERPAAWLYSRTVVPAGAPHILQKNLAIAAAIGATSPAIEMPLQPRPSAAVRAAIAARGAAPYAVLNPGAAWPNKRWPAEKFGALAAALRTHTGMYSIITWGPGEQALAERVSAASAGSATPAPATGMGELAAIMQGAALVVSGDTGPLHIAAAMGAPIVGLYGPTWPERNGPWHPDDEVISRADVCVCHHKRRCLRGAPCIDGIAVDTVLQAATRRLAKVAR